MSRATEDLVAGAVSVPAIHENGTHPDDGGTADGTSSNPPLWQIVQDAHEGLVRREERMVDGRRRTVYQKQATGKEVQP